MGKITNESPNRKLKKSGIVETKAYPGTAAVRSSAFRRLCGSMIGLTA
jgi:hypothetical protein